MKTQNLRKILAGAAIAGMALLASNAGAQTAAAPQLAYGVAEISQLAQAKVGDSTIIAYIKNSNLSYGLDANQIVYLRQQGVSDAVITTMLNQPKTVAAPVASVATVPTPTTPAPQVASTVSVPAVTVAPTVTYVQTVPTTTYYYAQPYYYPNYYYGGWAPNVSLSFGFGGYYGGHGGYYGGYHGGYGGGGYHGGGHH